MKSMSELVERAMKLEHDPSQEEEFFGVYLREAEDHDSCDYIENWRKLPTHVRLDVIVDFLCYYPTLHTHDIIDILLRNEMMMDVCPGACENFVTLGTLCRRSVAQVLRSRLSDEFGA